MWQSKSALIAMSGGVDSSVAAYLMKEQGYTCMGTTMKLYRSSKPNPGNFPTCCSETDIDDAKEVALQLDMPYQVLDFTADFQKQIIDRFVTTYEAGGTPNPCIDCNRFMKFHRLFIFADAYGLSKIVTGHYARIEQDPATGRYLLRKAVDDTKDQSYVLYMLTQEQLARTLFPLGSLTKAQVREIALAQGFVNAKKHDSQDICFVPDGDYVKFMEEYTGKQYPAGPFLNENGQPVGTHRGAVGYTIGQRKGLGLAMPHPVYVYEKDMQANTVSVGPESLLFSRELIADELNWISIPGLTEPIRVWAKTRYHQKEQPAAAYPDADGTIRIVFDEPQRAITEGQAVVMYQGDLVVGGGRIIRAVRH